MFIATDDGFLRGRGCVDHVFALKKMCKKYLKGKK